MHFSDDASSSEVRNSKHDLKTSRVAEEAPMRSAVKENTQVKVKQWFLVRNRDIRFLSIYCNSI